MTYHNVFAMASDIRKVFGLSEESLQIDCWTGERRRYSICLTINSHESTFFAASTQDAIDTLRTIRKVLSAVKQI